ncbi:MAG: hypothetical protein ACTSWK_07255 [Promethearchaeota archaeon]
MQKNSHHSPETIKKMKNFQVSKKEKIIREFLKIIKVFDKEQTENFIQEWREFKSE